MDRGTFQCFKIALYVRGSPGGFPAASALLARSPIRTNVTAAGELGTEAERLGETLAEADTWLCVESSGKAPHSVSRLNNDEP